MCLLFYFTCAFLFSAFAGVICALQVLLLPLLACIILAFPDRAIRHKNKIPITI
jgi:hypothetical protein